jgi:hypothetical protein
VKWLGPKHLAHNARKGKPGTQFWCSCGMLLNGYASADGEPHEAEEGDLSLCSKCGMVLRFRAGAFHPMLTSEWVMLPDDMRMELAHVALSNGLASVKTKKDRNGPSA